MSGRTNTTVLSLHQVHQSRIRSGKPSCGTRDPGSCRRSPTRSEKQEPISSVGRAYNGQDDHPWQVQLADDGLGEGRLAAAGAPSNPDDADIGPGRGIMGSLRNASVGPTVHDGNRRNGAVHSGGRNWVETL